MGKMGAWVGVVLLLTGAGPLTAQDTSGGDQSEGSDPAPVAATRLVRAAPSSGRIQIDGLLDEPAWQEAETASGFVQQRPDEGRPASEATDVRVLLDEENLYVGARLFDSNPDSIVARLSRRDQEVYSDWFYVYVDSYHDRRTAFGFAVNAAGVELDQRASEEDRLDSSWNAVWDAAVSIDDRGWVVEMEIPLSQLRFNNSADESLTWGVNFVRRLARKQEVSHWAPVPQDANRFVSLFGELDGVSHLVAPARIEATPYTVSRLTRAPGAAGDPFHDANAMDATFGGDLQLGLGGLTLSATFNPDFGQVEADPSFINLTAFEVFQQERRPFFVEGDDIFRPTHPMWPPTFYSRRIGRRPQGHLPSEASFGDVPDATTILGAAKLSGKTDGGWSVGLLSAVTRREEGRFTAGDGTLGSTTVEPRTHYGVARIARESDDGDTSIGLLATATHRDLGGTGLDFLHRAAYAGGIDGFHRFGGGAYEVRFSATGSLVQGTRGAIAGTQRAPGRYLTRPDAGHLRFDPNRTSLTGMRAGVQLQKSRGNWQFWSNADFVTSGYEINDLGFNTRLDEGAVWGQFGYNRFQPGRIFRNWSLNGAASTAYTLGSELTRRFLETNANFTLLNYWGGGFWVQRHLPGTVDVSRLRGGPAVRMDGRWAGGLWMNTDRRKTVSGRAFTFWEREDETGDGQVNMDATVTIRPLSAWTSWWAPPFLSGARPLSTSQPKR